jgi:hypothetical protein
MRLLASSSRLVRLGCSFAVIGTVLIASACGSEGDSTFGDPNGQSSGNSGGPPPGNLTKGDGGDGGDDLAGCASERRKAEPLPLDLFVMFDSSGSMATLVAPNVSKYKAVSDALAAFVNDPASAGIGIGMQFFPLPAAGVPASCTTSGDCPGTSGPCSMKACATNGPLKFCNTSADCGGGPPGPAISCVDVGRCSIAQNVYCLAGQPCGKDANGFDRGTCVAQTAGSCSNGDSCADADYVTPAVPIAALPGAAASITAALAAKAPDGNTPTSAALKGAVDAATAYANANPGHTVVAVLATDGLPTECDTNMANIASIAGAAFKGTPSVKTFVIGVFSADEKALAQSNLDQIASAGGSSKAFVVTQGATTTQDFVNAMNTIRGTALPCEYNLPVPESGTPDFGKLNVQHTATDGSKTVYPNRSDASKCDATGGWYYDVAPVNGATPSKIILCPATCDAVKTAGGQVDVVIGCTTQVR